MPRVPEYKGGLAPKPQGTPYSDVRYGPQDFGGQVGAALQEVGGEMAERANKARQKANAIALGDAKLEYQSEIDREMYDEKEGLTVKQGKAAFGEDTKAFDRLEQRRKDILSKRLATEELRQAFDLESREMTQGARRTAEQHLGRQQQVAAQATRQGTMALALNGLAQEFDLPDKRAERIAAPEKVIRDLALSKEDADAAVAEWRGKAHKVVLEQYLARGDGEGARSYFSQVKDEMGEGSASVAKAIAELERAQIGERQALQLLAAAKDAETGWVDPGKALAQLETVAPALKDEVAKRLEHHLRIAEALKKKAGEDMYEKVLSIYWQNGKNLLDPKIAPLKAWLLDERNDAVERWRQLARDDEDFKLRDREAQVRVDRDAEDHFKAKTPEDQASTNVDVEYGAQTSDPARNRIKAIQNRAVEDIRKAKRQGGTEFSRSVDATVAQTPRLAKSKKAATRFKAYMNNWLLEFRDRNNGRDPQKPDVDQGKAGAFKILEEEGLLWNTKGEAYELDPEAKQSFQPTTPAPEYQAPGRDKPSPLKTARDRAAELKAQGKTNKQIADQLTREGYTRGR